ncbi:MAG: metallophosphoesterase [Nitrososphaera sp.]
MNLRPLYPHAALLLVGSKNRSLVISDLHLGLESELSLKGVEMPRADLAKEMIGQIEALCTEHSVDQIVIAGDLKHTFGSITKQEWDEIPRFLSDLTRFGEVFLVPGNHDSGIRHLAPLQVNLASASGLTLEDTLVLHGHSLPSEIPQSSAKVVMGHLHPTLRKKGHVLNGQPVWIYLQVDRSILTSAPGSENIEMVVIPSFNRYLYAAGGRTVFGGGNRTSERTNHDEGSRRHPPRGDHKSVAISPVISRVRRHRDKIRRCMVTTLDGAVVGGESMLDEIL